jgi:hypothetical protein
MADADLKEYIIEGTARGEALVRPVRNLLPTSGIERENAETLAADALAADALQSAKSLLRSRSSAPCRPPLRSR